MNFYIFNLSCKTSQNRWINKKTNNPTRFMNTIGRLTTYLIWLDFKKNSLILMICLVKLNSLSMDKII